MIRGLAGAGLAAMVAGSLAAQEPRYKVGIVSESGDIVTWLKPQGATLVVDGSASMGYRSPTRGQYQAPAFTKLGYAVTLYDNSHSLASGTRPALPGAWLKKPSASQSRKTSKT